MNRNSNFLLACCLAVLGLTACSGPPGGGGCTTGCNPGNGNLFITMTATPPAPSANLNILSFSASIQGISLTSSTGSSVTVPLNSGSSAYLVEFTRLTTDTTYVGKVSVPSGSYTGISLIFGTPFVKYCTQPTSGTQGCTETTLPSRSGSVGSASITTSLNIASNQAVGLAIDANLANALTTSGQAISSINLGATNVFTLKTLPGTSDLTTASQLAHVDDLTGIVTNVNTSAKTVTVQTATRGSFTAVANDSTVFDTSCATQDFTCVQSGNTVNMDTILNNDGTFTLTYYDPIDTTADDLIEGVITGLPNSGARQFTMVVTDATTATSGSILAGQVALGDTVLVTLAASPSPFFVDAKGMLIASGENFDGATTVDVLQPGQTVLAHLTSFTAAGSSTPAAAGVDGLALRFSRVSASVASLGSPQFNVTNAPLFYGFTNNPQVQLTTSGQVVTSFDNVTSFSGITTDDVISMRAIFVGPGTAPQLSPAAIRKH